MTVLESAISAPWAMLPERIEELVSIAGRYNEAAPEALEAYRAQAAERGERLLVRDGVGILDVTGPLFKRANLFVRISGATSYEILRRDLQAALDDPSIHAIMLRIDSPGGEANGCDELARAIYEARGKKPITAFVSGMAASGGYWLASAAERVVVSDAAVLGSIGVVLGMRLAKDDGKTIEFVSAQSPGKRPDPTTDAGKARIQEMVDDLADVFIASVAKFRGVSPETVVKKFGEGGVKVGAKAVAAGMADEVGQFEAALSALSKRGKSRRSNPLEGGFLMSETTKTAAVEEKIDVAKIEADAGAKAVAAYKARQSAIMGCDGAKQFPKLAASLVDNAALTTEVAIGMLAAALAEAPKVEAPKALEKTYEQRKTEAGTLGLGQPEATDAERKTAEDGWSKAVGRVNASLGPNAI